MTLSSKLEPVEFDKGEIIIRKGDDATCMYVLYSGIVSVYTDAECKNFAATITTNKVLGEAAL